MALSAKAFEEKLNKIINKNNVSLFFILFPHQNTEILRVLLVFLVGKFNPYQLTPDTQAPPNLFVLHSLQWKSPCHISDPQHRNQAVATE